MMELIHHFLIYIGVASCFVIFPLRIYRRRIKVIVSRVEDRKPDCDMPDYIRMWGTIYMSICDIASCLCVFNILIAVTPFFF